MKPRPADTIRTGYRTIRPVGARFLDWLLGPHCALGCGQRLYPRDIEAHYYIEHAAEVPE